MAGPWISDDDLADELAAALQRPDRSALETFWLSRVARANAEAANEITGAMVARGFTASQIDAWDRRQELNRTLGLWALLRDGLALSGMSPDAIKMFDRRRDLSVLPVCIGGAVVNPAANATTGGAAIGGRMAPPDSTVTMDTVF